MVSLFSDFDYLNDMIVKTHKSWNRVFSEKDGYVAVKPKNGDGILMVFNTLGVSKDNLKVSYKKVADREVDRYFYDEESVDSEYYAITVSGSTKYSELFDKEYSANYTIYLKIDLEKVQFTSKDGLTFVYVTGTEQSKKAKTETEVTASDSIAW